MKVKVRQHEMIEVVGAGHVPLVGGTEGGGHFAVDQGIDLSSYPTS